MRSKENQEGYDSVVSEPGRFSGFSVLHVECPYEKGTSEQVEWEDGRLDGECDYWDAIERSG